MKSLRNSKGLYWGLIIAFFILYMLVGFVSTLHSITFFQLANVLWMAVLLGVTYEVGQASVLFSILMSDNNKKLLPWLLMILLTALQVTANVYASFKFMDSSGSMDWTYWQRSILFWLEADGPEMYKVAISWITGALLPVVALGMTALVAENLKLKDESDSKETKEELKDPKDPKDPIQEPDKIKETLEEVETEEETEEEIKEIIKEPIVEDEEIFPNSILDPDSENLRQLLLDPSNTLKKYPQYPIDNESGTEVIRQPLVVDLNRNINPIEEDSSNKDIEISSDKSKDDGYDSDDELKNLSKELDKDLKRFEKEKNEEVKKPINNPRGWHLKEKHIDSNGDVYRYGTLVNKEENDLKKAQG